VPETNETVKTHRPAQTSRASSNHSAWRLFVMVVWLFLSTTQPESGNVGTISTG